MRKEMSQQIRTFSTSPLVHDGLTRKIGMLQQLQVLLSTEATLGDAARQILQLQEEFGPRTSLEDVIQALVGQHLTRQIASRHK
jgi:hypothetical protein